MPGCHSEKFGKVLDEYCGGRVAVKSPFVVGDATDQGAAEDLVNVGLPRKLWK